jgi:hypothetical protein
MVLALAVSGCGGSKKEALTRYVQQVNTVASGMRLELEQVAAVNAGFRSTADLAALAPKFARADRTLGTFAARLAALDPPPEAKPVAATLAKLVAVERDLVAELHRFAVFLPAFRRALAPYGRAVAAFRNAASSVKTAKAEASVVDVYANALSKPLAALARLSPPAVLAPTYTTEVRLLRRSRATALSLAAALRAGRAAQAHTLLVQLSQIAVSGGSLAAQRAQIKAVRAYDAEVARATALENRAQLELVHLQG